MAIVWEWEQQRETLRATYGPEGEAIYERGICPCGGKLLSGPRGGGAQNLKCQDCGQKWWIGWPFKPECL